jgi:hypothetical protein
MTNPKSTLNEMCQKNRWEKHTVVFRHEGPPNHRKWYATVTLSVPYHVSALAQFTTVEAHHQPLDGETILISTGEHFNKKDSEKIACQKLVEEIKKLNLSQDTIIDVLYSDSDYSSDCGSISTVSPTSSNGSSPTTSPRMSVEIPNEIADIMFTGETINVRSSHSPKKKSKKSSKKTIPIPSVQLNNGTTIWLIDVENKRVKPKSIPDNQNTIAIGFTSTFTGAYVQYPGWKTIETDDLDTEIQQRGRRLLCTATDGYDDMADHLLTMYLFSVVEYIDTHRDHGPFTVKLVSGDKAIFCSKICLDKLLQFKKITDVCIEVVSVIV